MMVDNFINYHDTPSIIICIVCSIYEIYFQKKIQWENFLIEQNLNSISTHTSDTIFRLLLVFISLNLKTTAFVIAWSLYYSKHSPGGGYPFRRHFRTSPVVEQFSDLTILPTRNVTASVRCQTTVSSGKKTFRSRTKVFCGAFEPRSFRD